jgi:hypothetical protein
VKKKKRLKQLAWREYLPLAATAAMWAVIVLSIGHADTARLLAAVVMVRAVQLCTRLATGMALNLRLQASAALQRQAKRFAFAAQTAALAIALMLVALIAEGMKAIDQKQIAAFLPYVALGMPARYWRQADVRTSSPFLRLALALSGLVTVSFGWALGWPVTLMGLAFSAREWVAYFVLRWWPRAPRIPKQRVDEPLHFDEVARYTVILGRRLLTYRLTKSLLSVFGPIGNAAARTGRGLNWHSRFEPYMPHHFGGFVGFSLLTLGAAFYLAMRSGEPAAMVVAAGVLQVSGATLNVVMLWRWLPHREVDIQLGYDDDDE